MTKLNQKERKKERKLIKIALELFRNHVTVFSEIIYLSHTHVLKYMSNQALHDKKD